MKPLLTFLLAVCFILSVLPLFSQSVPDAVKAVTDTAAARKEAAAAAKADDDFSAFLLAFGSVFLCVMAGAVVVGAVAASALLLFIFGLVSAGILSSAVVVGIHRRSFFAGFKTFLVIVCGLGGAGTGVLVMWIVRKVFALHLSWSMAAWSGAAGGLVGGILLGYSIYAITRVLTGHFRKKLAIAIG